MFKRFIVGAFLALVVGCASMGAPALNSNEEKLAAAEITFQEMVVTAINIAPRLSTSNKDKVFELLDSMHKALVVARLALSSGDMIDFSNQITIVRSAISVLRPILESMEETGGISNGISIQHFSTA